MLPITQVVLIEGDVELVGHDLAERGARALAEVGLADEERGGVVGTDDDPRIELHGSRDRDRVQPPPGWLLEERVHAVDRDRGDRGDETSGLLEES